MDTNDTYQIIHNNYLPTESVDRSFGLKEEIYKFERIKREKRAAIKKNPDMELIDLGVGEPDSMADLSVVEMLVGRG